jgi:hypothetical protein
MLLFQGILYGIRPVFRVTKCRLSVSNGFDDGTYADCRLLEIVSKAPETNQLHVTQLLRIVLHVT